MSQLIFTLLLIITSYLFTLMIFKIRKNIFLGKEYDKGNFRKERWKTMFLVALGQGKMFTKPIAAFFHIFVYLGFILINIEVLEIAVDGIFNTHRFFSNYLGSLYSIVIGFFEIMALLVIISCIIFLIRRHVLKIKRLNHIELRGFPQRDATGILIIEIVLMSALLLMNAADYNLQLVGAEHYHKAGYFPVSSNLISPFIFDFSDHALMVIERFAWWFHYLGILAFILYLPQSKHFHIIMAFPNTYYTRLEAKGKLVNNESITQEVKLMMDPSLQPPIDYIPPSSFGVKDVSDLTWKNLMDAYSCTECGRCTDACPANITGKKLSPRKIMMDTRDRLEIVGDDIEKESEEYKEKSLHDYISAEELWACTTCNACVEACPINISPLEIIIGMRQYLVMEKSDAPAELNAMMTNLENNSAPWQFSPMDRGNWTQEL